MRKLLLVFLMIFLPLQWSAALAADCCVRHDAKTQEHHAQMHGESHEHAKVEKSADDGSQAKVDCNMDCVGCHAHHCAAALFELGNFTAAVPADMPDTPYLSRVPTPLPDNLFRPPLSRLA